jgi:hypothetical protein
MDNRPGLPYLAVEVCFISYDELLQEY